MRRPVMQQPAAVGAMLAPLAPLIDPDTIQRRPARPGTPERVLLAEVLLLALRDAEGEILVGEKRVEEHRKIKSEARMWLRSRDTQPFSAAYIFDHLGLDHGAFLRDLRRRQRGTRIRSELFRVTGAQELSRAGCPE